MNLAILFVLFALVGLGVVVRIAVLPSLQLSRNTQRDYRIEPIDVEAFRNLCDPAEDEYLRRKLPEPDYRQVRRVRVRALATYVRVASTNAAVLVYLGQSAIHSTDRRTADAARELVGEALLLRRNAAFALFRIYVAMAWPNTAFVGAPFLDGYRQLSGSAMLLGRLQNPSAPVRISAS